MIVLAIDLGETTGYAYVGGDTLAGDDVPDVRLIRNGTLKLGVLPAVDRLKPDLVVIERPAYVESRMQDAYAEAIHAFKVQFGAKVKVVRAADWMPRFMHLRLPGRGVLPTQHEKDAYRMGVWALDRFGEGGKDYSGD